SIVPVKRRPVKTSLSGPARGRKTVGLPLVVEAVGPPVSRGPVLLTVALIFILIIAAFLMLMPWQQTVQATGRVIAFSPSLLQTDPSLAAQLDLERNAILARIQAATERDRQLDARMLEHDQALRRDIRAADLWIEQTAHRAQTAAETVEAVKGDSQAVPDLRRTKAALASARSSRVSAEADRVRVLDTGDTLIRSSRAAREATRGEIEQGRKALHAIDARLKAGQEIASLMPKGADTAAEVWIAGNDLRHVRLTSRARLEFESWPAIRIPGWPALAVGTFGGIVTAIEQNRNPQSHVRVIVIPDPQSRPWPSAPRLRPGMRAKAIVLLNSMPEGDELGRQTRGRE
ncbi:MAG: hypothetical protein WKF37_23785, partial [Bryobacteraceae bacterium]